MIDTHMRQCRGPRLLVGRRVWFVGSGAIFCISIKSVDPAMARFCRESLNATYVLDLVDAPVDFDHNPLQATSPVHGLHVLFRRIVTGADHHHDPTAARDCGYYRDCGADAEAAETESTKLVSNVDVAARGVRNAAEEMRKVFQPIHRRSQHADSSRAASSHQLRITAGARPAVRRHRGSV